MTEKAARLYPPPSLEIPARSIYGDLRLPPPGWQNARRPYVIVNMIRTLDGSISVGAKASPLGSQTDRQTMRNLRSHADAVLIGAGTLRAEKLSLGLDHPAPGTQPLAVIATNSGDLPLDSNLVISEGQELLVMTTVGGAQRVPESKATVRVVPGDRDGNLDLAEALQALKAANGVDLLLVEGGPRLNAALVANNLADELFLTVAPQLSGGSQATTILDKPSHLPRTLPVELLAAHIAPEELFLRYRLLKTHNTPATGEAIERF